jgi:preprotein translocase subunit SecA
LYEKDIHYVIQDGKVVIIDEHTGRAMPGRRWSDGLHQAIECKENLAIERETKTYATITLQNYFRMYERLSGMTGTAETEASEFYDIYRLPVVVIPTHKPCIRKDLNDLIFKTRREKYNAALATIQEAHQRGQPVLVGTTSIEASEVVSKLLKRAQVPHTVLNAKYHQQEAEIVARAGQRGAVTVATNMAGRGTDIKLGAGVEELGGLMVLGTERHEAARIDLQLRGRCSRQGDPGLCRFFVSLEDDLMRLFTNANLIGRLVQNAFQEGEPMEHPLLNKALRNAQKKVEEQNFAIRKRLLQYDDVLDKQRSVIYAVRNEALRTDNPKELLLGIVDEEIHVRMDNNPVSGFRGTFQAGELDPYFFWFNSTFPFGLQQKDFNQWTFGDLAPRLTRMVRKAYDEKERYEDPEGLRGLERFLIIHFFDKHWQDHLTEMEDLRKSISLRGYGQKDPLNEYKNEAYTLFDGMVRRAREDICRNLFRSATSTQALQKMLESLSNRVHETGPEGEASLGKTTASESLPNGATVLPVQRGVKVGRNDPCPCGSTKKFKKCCSQEEND